MQFSSLYLKRLWVPLTDSGCSDVFISITRQWRKAPQYTAIWTQCPAVRCHAGWHNGKGASL